MTERRRTSADRRRGHAGLAWVLAASALSLVVACGGKDSVSPDSPEGQQQDEWPPAGLAPCPSAPFLTQFPVPLSSINQISPLGFMSGMGHLFPSAHVAIHQADGLPDGAPISAPGPITIVNVRRTKYTPPAPTTYDYAIFYFPCADILMHFGHAAALDASIDSMLGTWTEEDCEEPYVVNSISVEQCTKDITVSVPEGSVLGTHGVVALDWSARDRRDTLAYVAPDRLGGSSDAYGLNNVHCPVDYFVSDVRDSVHDLFGEEGVTRTAEPVCGTVNEDLAGTAQGRWFVNDDWEETLHLALVHDFVDPSVGAISVGQSVPSLPWGLYRFTPTDTGRINVDFPHVTPDGQIYCYEPFATGASPYTILIQLLSSTQIRIEGVEGDTCGDPDSWAFTSGSATFDR